MCTFISIQIYLYNSLHILKILILTFFYNFCVMLDKKAELQNMIKNNEKKGTRVRRPPARVLDSASSDPELHKA